MLTNRSAEILSPAIGNPHDNRSPVEAAFVPDIPGLSYPRQLSGVQFLLNISAFSCLVPRQRCRESVLSTDHEGYAIAAPKISRG
jgi:hypothetical protein